MLRRDFIKAAAATALAPVVGRVSDGYKESQQRKVTQQRYWIWSGVSPNESRTKLKERYADLKSKGLSGVFISGVDDREFEIIAEAGLEVHTWMWTTNRGDEWIMKNHPEWYMVSRSGKSCRDQPPYVGYYRWISPVIPAVQSYLEERVAELAAHPAVTGVHLDYVRYPDVILPKALWRQYGLDQTEELPDYDFDYGDAICRAFKSATGRDPREIENPAHDQQWLHFRYDSVTKLVEKLSKVAHSHQKKITAAVFPTPRMARKICRQDWDKWPLDAACPMIYNSFYDESVDWIGECVLENVQAVRFPVYAGLYMPALSNPDDFAKALALCTKRGAAGASFFGGIDPAHWDVLEKHRSEL